MDTHVVVYLYSGQLDLIKPKILRMINENPVCVSYIVRLELKYLNEVGKIKHTPEVILNALIDDIGLVFSKNSFDRIINHAVHLDFTRDPFDRIIVADASINDSILVSRDDIIKKNYKNTIW